MIKGWVLLISVLASIHIHLTNYFFLYQMFFMVEAVCILSRTYIEKVSTILLSGFHICAFVLFLTKSWNKGFKQIPFNVCLGLSFFI